MIRRQWLWAILGVAAIGIVATYFLTTRGGPRSVRELTTVHYSRPELWADFYVNRLPEGTGWVHLPQSAGAGQFKSEVDPAKLGFVRPEVCGECHADKYQGFKSTAHFATSTEATRETVLGSFEPDKNRLKTRDPDLHFLMTLDEDGPQQRVIVEKDGKTYEHREKIDLVIGSGNHGQTYLYWLAGELYQLPVSYFAEAKGWVNSPGLYRDGTADFARGIGHRCLDCHATFFSAKAGEHFRYDQDKEKYILGVTCVRCHGHGWAHVQYHRTHPDDKKSRYIVHPGKLPRERTNEICAQCHSGVGDLLAPAFSYQPGEPLDRYLHLDPVLEDPSNEDPHAANQLARLMKSRCYQEGQTLTCVTCHDPHRPEPKDLSFFSDRCATCHQPGTCKIKSVPHEKLKDHCVECHMPSRRDVEGAMQTTEGQLLPLLRDHYIKVWPDLTQPVLKKMQSD